MGSELKQTSSHLNVAKAELEAYQRRSERQITSLNRKVDVAQAERARAQSKAAMDVASTAAAKDREVERLQMQLADAQRKHAAAMDVKEGAELKAKRQETLRKQAERRAVSSEKAKSKSDTALEKAQAKNARLRQLKNDSNKRAREAEKKSSRMQRIYEKSTALTGHLQEQLDSQKAETATLAQEVEVRAEDRELGNGPGGGPPGMGQNRFSGELWGSWAIPPSSERSESTTA